MIFLSNCLASSRLYIFSKYYKDEIVNLPQEMFLQAILNGLVWDLASNFEKISNC